MTDFDYLATRQQHLRDHQQWRSLVPRAADGIYLIESDDRRLLNFGANDYLGLALEMRDRMAGSIGNGDSVHVPVSGGSGASALVSGWTKQHQRLSEQIAEFEGTESAVLFPTGFAACSGTVSALAEAGDLVLSDQLNHASLIDGCRMSRAERIVYPHADWKAVDHILRQRRDEFARVWIVTNTVFGMDGHVAPMDHLHEIAQTYSACLIADEAHGTGVLGQDGSGVCEALGVKDKVKIRIGTLSKAVGSQGGFVAAPRVVIDHLVNHCRPLIYSTSLTPAAVVAATVGIDQIRTQPQRQRRVNMLARRVRSQLSIEASTDLEASVPIIPVVVGEQNRAVQLSRQLADSGFYVPAIRPPTVAEGTARLRISLSAAHEDGMIEQLLDAVQALL